MEKEKKLKEAISSLEYIVEEPYIQKDIERLRGKLAEEKTISNLLGIGVDSDVLKQTFCNYFWAKFYKIRYENKIKYHKAGEKAGVPTLLYPIDYKYLESRVLYWESECKRIENMYITSISKNKEEISEETKQKVIAEIIKQTSKKDKKVIASYQAIDRYSSLTSLKKIKENVKRNNPSKINFDAMTIDEINSLYENKKSKAL